MFVPKSAAGLAEAEKKSAKIAVVAFGAVEGACDAGVADFVDRVQAAFVAVDEDREDKIDCSVEQDFEVADAAGEGVTHTHSAH